MKRFSPLGARYIAQFPLMILTKVLTSIFLYYQLPEACEGFPEFRQLLITLPIQFYLVKI